jgi:hypothetical protein
MVGVYALVWKIVRHVVRSVDESPCDLIGRELSVPCDVKVARWEAEVRLSLLVKVGGW